MKITKDYLRQVIRESLEEAGNPQTSSGAEEVKSVVLPVIKSAIESVGKDQLMKFNLTDFNDANREALEKDLGAIMFGYLMKHKNSVLGIG